MLSLSSSCSAISFFSFVFFIFSPRNSVCNNIFGYATRPKSKNATQLSTTTESTFFFCFEPAYVCMFLCDLNNEQWCISHFGKCAFFHCARTHARELSDFTIVMCITSLSFAIQVGTIWLQNNNGRRMKEFFNKNLGFWKIRNSRGYWSAVTAT